MNHAQFWGGGGAAPYEIEQSLRFERASSHYLNETFSAGQTTWTVSFWVKRANLNGVVQCLFGTSTNGFYNDLGFEGSDRLRFRQVYSGVPSENFEMLSTMRFRDPSAWYHIVLSYGAHDGSAAADRAKIWVNNQRLTAFDTANYPGANVSSLLNANNRVHNIGKVGFYDDYLGAYIAEFNFIDGQRLDPTDFGEEDNNGVWRPIKFAGTYGNNNSVYLKFDPTATNGIGHDHSGNGNNWTANNFTTSGTGTDVMSDTPTTNYATLNPLDPLVDTLSEGNLKSTGTNNWESRRATFAMTSGKWYWEVTPTFPAGDYVFVGVVNKNADLTQYVGQDANGWGFDTYTPAIVNNSSGTSYGTNPTSGTVLGFAFDADTGKMWVRDASGFYSSGDPAAGTNPAMTAGAGEYYPAVSNATSSTVSNTVNFGQRAFAYTPPTGFKALNTSNLPAPDIADGSKYFDTLTWTGDSSGATRTFSGLAFQPDFVWAKGRNQAISHQLTDAVRGAGATSLRSDDNRIEGAEGTSSGYLSAFTSDGFTSTSSSTNVYYNTNTYTYVAWNWLGANGTSSNTAGSITSTVSANPKAGFSIVTYTSPNDSADQTVGHGLGVKPSLIMVKNRDNTYNWDVYHSSLGYNASLILSSTNATRSGAFGAEPTSTVFTTKTSYTHNGTQKYVAYCFAEVEGYSKFGIYASNNSSDGPFVYTGFKPALVVVKSVDGHGGWMAYDAARMEFNPGGDNSTAYPLSWDRNYAESSFWNAYQFDILSNGFKLRSNQGDVNYSGNYVYLAFAENPFGGDGVSPATAR